MNDYKEQKVRIVVQKSKCNLYKKGDQITIDGPLVDISRTDRVCVTALQAIYPFIFALRKGVTPEAMGFEGQIIVQCPDYCAPVIFSVMPFFD